MFPSWEKKKETGRIGCSFHRLVFAWSDTFFFTTTGAFWVTGVTGATVYAVVATVFIGAVLVVVGVGELSPQSTSCTILSMSSLDWVFVAAVEVDTWLPLSYLSSSSSSSSSLSHSAPTLGMFQLYHVPVEVCSTQSWILQKNDVPKSKKILQTTMIFWNRVGFVCVFIGI